MEGEQCILITNDATLYTIFVPGLRENDFEFFDLVVGQHFLKNLLYENCPNELIKNILLQCNHMSMDKTLDRRILGTLKRLRKKLEYIVRLHGGLDKTDYYELNSILNRVILKSNDGKCPIEMFKQKLPLGRRTTI
jgi:hypothetical protein